MLAVTLSRVVHQKSNPPPPGPNPLPLAHPHAQGNPGLVTLSCCGGPNGFGHREQTRKEGSGGQGRLWLLKVAQQTALSRGPDRVKLPDNAGPTACGPLGPVTLPSRDSVCRGCLFSAVAASPTAHGPMRPVVLPSRVSERRGCLYVPPTLHHHPLPPSLHPVALLTCTPIVCCP